MEACFITTYRCNAHCEMCQIWKKRKEIHKEIGAEILEKLPNGLKKINISGGEPGLRKDLLDIVSVIHKNVKKLT